MKRLGFVIVLFATVYIALLGFSSVNKELPVEQIKKNYIKNLNAFVQACEQLDNEAQKSNPNFQLLQSHLLEARNTYKKIEFLFEYIDQTGARDLINGAPLPKPERNAPNLVILEPKGLQVLDELIFSDEPNLNEIQKQTLSLVDNIHRMEAIHKQFPLQDRHIFEAIRFELVRIITLGLTGFDTPLSGNSLPENQIAFHSLYQALTTYSTALEKNNSHLNEELKSLFETGLSQFKNQTDFNTFNRLSFIQKVAQPLFSNVLNAQLALGVEHFYEVNNQIVAFNYLSESIYSDDFLNPYYYTSLKSNKNSDLLTNLGKKLFFDPVLSRNNQRSCASCHNPNKAFTDGLPKSQSIDFNGTVERNSPTIVNAVYADRFFHDLRAENLNLQTEHVFFSNKEFDTDIITIIDKLNSSSEYKSLFTEAFQKAKQDALITKMQINFAFEAYVLSLRSFNSQIDKYLRGENVELTASVKNGFNLFMGKAACGTCHFAPTFSGLVPPHFDENESEVLGIALNPYDTPSVVDPDGGRAAAGFFKEETSIYLNSFKTPTVRNSALTAPYMHNGAYMSLEDVMHFYNAGGGTGIGIRLENQTLPSDSLGLTNSEIQDIIDFLNALTDTTGLTSPPKDLPKFPIKELNNRTIGGTY